MNKPLFHDSMVVSDRILYTPSTFARSSLLHLQETGTLEARKPHTSHRRGLTSYLFFLVESGSGFLEYEGQSFLLRSGDCVFIDCRKDYAHITENDLWKLKWAHFYGPNMSSIYEKYRERGGLPCFHPRNPENFDFILNRLYELAASEDYIRDMKLCEALTSLLTLLMAESWYPEKAARPAAKRQNLQEIKDYLDTHYREKISLDELAERFFINKFYLTRIFKEQFGLSVNNYLLQIRITHAKRLLRFTDLTIEAIGQECGMTDANYFSRMFKKTEGITPGEFRKLWCC